jgi:hypothetical protein
VVGVGGSEISTSCYFGINQREQKHGIVQVSCDQSTARCAPECLPPALSRVARSSLLPSRGLAPPSGVAPGTHSSIWGVEVGVGLGGGVGCGSRGQGGDWREAVWWSGAALPSVDEGRWEREHGAYRDLGCR